MARGWESKAVEEQQSMAPSRGRRDDAPLTEDEAEAARRIASLKLARAKVMSDLQRACRPAHRTMLEAALGDIDGEIARGNGSGGGPAGGAAH